MSIPHIVASDRVFSRVRRNRYKIPVFRPPVPPPPSRNRGSRAAFRCRAMSSSSSLDAHAARRRTQHLTVQEFHRPVVSRAHAGVAGSAVSHPIPLKERRKLRHPHVGQFASAAANAADPVVVPGQHAVPSLPAQSGVHVDPHRWPEVGGTAGIVQAWGGASRLLRLVPAEPPPSTMASVIAVEGPPVVLVIARASMEKGGSPSPPYLSSFTPRIRPLFNESIKFL